MCAEELEMLHFLFDHNQCAEWVFGGDPTRMILRAAMGTSSQRAPTLRIV